MISCISILKQLVSLIITRQGVAADSRDVADRLGQLPDGHTEGDLDTGQSVNLNQQLRDCTKNIDELLLKLLDSAEVAASEDVRHDSSLAVFPQIYRLLGGVSRSVPPRALGSSLFRKVCKYARCRALHTSSQQSGEDSIRSMIPTLQLTATDTGHLGNIGSFSQSAGQVQEDA